MFIVKRQLEERSLRFSRNREETVAVSGGMMREYNER